MRDRHHRRPKSLGGDYSDRNISVVPPKYHRAWHLLFGNDSPQEIAKKITEIWIDPDYYVIAVPRKKRKPRRVKDGLVKISIRVYNKTSRQWATVQTVLNKRGK